jgi:hypothetical protein
MCDVFEDIELVSAVDERKENKLYDEGNCMNERVIINP